jgi:hypothetical protein
MTFNQAAPGLRKGIAEHGRESGVHQRVFSRRA